MALDLPETSESAHVGHPDFRVRGKIFATLGYPDDDYGVLMLTPDEQSSRNVVRGVVDPAIKHYPKVFSPAAGAWGKRGSTMVLLSAISGKQLRPYMEKAWQEKMPKRRV